MIILEVDSGDRCACYLLALGCAVLVQPFHHSTSLASTHRCYWLFFWGFANRSTMEGQPPPGLVLVWAEESVLGW